MRPCLLVPSVPRDRDGYPVRDGHAVLHGEHALTRQRYLHFVKRERMGSRHSESRDSCVSVLLLLIVLFYC